ncbi:hypothetical protein WL83_17405 [Burkholderia ubonensis]|nr:hypothetical protein WL83_17405 [Burkholderia ubonensis]
MAHSLSEGGNTYAKKLDYALEAIQQAKESACAPLEFPGGLVFLPRCWQALHMPAINHLQGFSSVMADNAMANFA